MPETKRKRPYNRAPHQYPDYHTVELLPSPLWCQARRLGLVVKVYRYTNTEMWMVLDANTRKEIGSWIPRTGSYRAGKAMGIAENAGDALAAFGLELERTRGGRGT